MRWTARFIAALLAIAAAAELQGAAAFRREAPPQESASFFLYAVV